MNAYTVRCIPPGAFEGYRAEVEDAYAHYRGIGYGGTEREAIRRAWSAYWKKAAVS